MERYQPGAIVLQCGADSLSGDRLGCFNLSLRGGCWSCVRVRVRVRVRCCLSAPPPTATFVRAVVPNVGLVTAVCVWCICVGQAMRTASSS